MLRTIKTLAILALLLAVATPALAQRRPAFPENTLRVRVGLFEPDGASDYWKFGDLDDPDSTVFTGQASDFEDVIVGIDYVRFLSPRLGVMFSFGGYEAEENQAYLFFEDQFGGDIVHTTRLEVGQLTAGLLFNLTAANRRVVPYLGAGGGLYSWDLEEAGDFIDFGVFPLEIFRASFQDDGNALGWYWMAGVKVGLSRTWGFFAEIREHDAEDDLSGDFAGFGEIDLSGREISGGFTWDF